MTTTLANRTENTDIEVHRSVAEVVRMTRLVQEVLGSVMKEGQHFGKIPGCGDKPALFKSGAEKLCVTFRLSAQPEVQVVELPLGHREYRVTAKLIHIPTGDCWGAGVGSCSTMEKKYRWRDSKGNDTLTDVVVPRGYWDAKKAGNVKVLGRILEEAMGEQGKFGTKKSDDGVWLITRRSESGGERVENPDIADTYNTVLKMAKKRAMVDGVLTATAASDLLTQDIEELLETEARIAPVVEQATEDTPPVKKPEFMGDPENGVSGDCEALLAEINASPEAELTGLLNRAYAAIEWSKESTQRIIKESKSVRDGFAVIKAAQKKPSQVQQFAAKKVPPRRVPDHIDESVPSDIPF